MSAWFVILYLKLQLPEMQKKNKRKKKGGGERRGGGEGRRRRLLSHWYQTMVQNISLQHFVFLLCPRDSVLLFFPVYEIDRLQPLSVSTSFILI